LKIVSAFQPSALQNHTAALTRIIVLWPSHWEIRLALQNRLDNYPEQTIEGQVRQIIAPGICLHCDAALLDELHRG